MGLGHTVSAETAGCLTYLVVEQGCLSVAKGLEGLVILGAQFVNAFVHTLLPETPLGTSL